VENNFLTRSLKSRCGARSIMLKENIVFEDLKKSSQGNNLHRGHLQIFVEILNSCQKPQVKTRVMYQTNISYKMLQTCLPQLLGSELLQVHHSVERYSTTKKGFEFLAKWKELQELLQP
jgi:predicted transcriptional regulator